MIIETKQEKATILGAEVTKFALNLKDPSIFVQMLINLYSDPIGSSVREYLSNAFDANKESKSDKPIVIGIDNNKFFIQDYGQGLSPEFMDSSTEGYCTIGFSTKRESAEMIGAYGFGRVTFLAYTDQYWVNTVYEGIVYEYLIFLDGNVIKQTLLSKQETTDPSGTRVVVQIKPGDLSKWKNAIRKQAAYFEGTLISGVESDILEVKVEKNNLIRTSNINNEDTHIVLGSVFYTIPWDKFYEWSCLKDLDVGIYVGLDEGLVPTPSRESWILNDFSKQLIESKFIQIAESICEDCNKILEELRLKSDILKLKFIYEGFVGGIKISQYEDLCKVLNKPKVSLLDYPFSESRWENSQLYTSVRNYFSVQGKNPVYLDKITPLKKEFVGSYARSSSELPRISHLLRIDVPENIVDYKDKSDYKTKEAQLIVLKLIEEYKKEFFLPFDEDAFLKWKSERKVVRTHEVKKGITYYRAHHYANDQCTEEKGHVVLNNFRYVFKANKENAQKYWMFLRSLFKNMIITKTEGYDLNELKPSPFLKRMCSQALKIRVYNIIGEKINSPKILDFINELNPLLYQYIKEVGFNNIKNDESDLIPALIEAGELLNIFDKDEIKLRFIEHHLNKLKLIKKLANDDRYRYDSPLTEEDKQIIKRLYTLERLAEKKWEKEELPIDSNQLMLELCY